MAKPSCEAPESRVRAPSEARHISSQIPLPAQPQGRLKTDQALADFSYRHLQLHPLPFHSIPRNLAKSLATHPTPSSHILFLHHPKSPCPCPVRGLGPVPGAAASGQGAAARVLQGRTRSILPVLGLEETPQHGDTRFCSKQHTQSAAALATGCKPSSSSALAHAPATRSATGGTVRTAVSSRRRQQLLSRGRLNWISSKRRLCISHIYCTAPYNEEGLRDLGG